MGRQLEFLVFILLLCKFDSARLTDLLRSVLDAVDLLGSVFDVTLNFFEKFIDVQAFGNLHLVFAFDFNVFLFTF